MANDQAFSRVDGQGAGLKELRLTRELSLMWETRLYFGNGELMESETVVVGVQGRGEICGGTRDEVPENHVAPVQVQHCHNHPHALPPTPVKCRNNSSSNSSSSVRTHLVALQSILNLETAGESAVGKSRYLPLSHIRPPHLHTSETHPPLVWFSDS